jgi:hypothetical protein
MADNPIKSRAAALAELRIDSTDSDYLGTPEELLLAGVIEPYMLERGFPPCGEMSTRDEYGHRIVIHRRADGRFKVRRGTHHMTEDKRSAQTIEKVVGAIVGEILSRFTAQPQAPFRPSAQSCDSAEADGS